MQTLKIKLDIGLKVWYDSSIGYKFNLTKRRQLCQKKQ